MIEVVKNLWVGSESDYESKVRFETGWNVVHACKEPYHRKELGYNDRGAPKTHPEYLLADRGNRLMLNLVDAPNPSFFSKDLVDKAVEWAKIRLADNRPLLVHCNEGRSRCALISLCLTASLGLSPDTFEQAEVWFRDLYPPYKPGNGVRGFLVKNYHLYLPS